MTPGRLRDSTAERSAAQPQAGETMPLVSNAVADAPEGHQLHLRVPSLADASISGCTGISAATPHRPRVSKPVENARSLDGHQRPSNGRPGQHRFSPAARCRRQPSTPPWRQCSREPPVDQP